MDFIQATLLSNVSKTLHISYFLFDILLSGHDMRNMSFGSISGVGSPPQNFTLQILLIHQTQAILSYQEKAEDDMKRIPSMIYE